MRQAMPILAVCALLALPAAAAPPTQGDMHRRIRETALSRGVPEKAAARFARAIDQAMEAGLPVESVGDKVLEGLAKGVEPARIAAAAEDLVRRLGAAQQTFAEAGIELAPNQRRMGLDRLAAILQGQPDGVLALARASRGADPQSLVAAARQLGELRARGIEAPQAVPALAPLARENRAAEIARVSALLDDYLAEGGADRAGFLQEVKRRAEQGLSLGDLVDPFGRQADPLNRSRRGHSKEPRSEGQPLLEKHDRAGSAPGLDRDSAGRKAKDCINGKGKGKPNCP
jgi:hypothetical protein